jgi:hypothetical protein
MILGFVGIGCMAYRRKNNQNQMALCRSNPRPHDWCKPPSGGFVAKAQGDREISRDSLWCGAADRKCVLAAAVQLSLDEVRCGGKAMRTREMTPIWVWLTFGLMAIGTVLYLTGYFMLEDIFSLFKWRCPWHSVGPVGMHLNGRVFIPVCTSLGFDRCLDYSVVSACAWSSSRELERASLWTRPNRAKI